jgi:hypothetical protein
MNGCSSTSVSAGLAAGLLAGCPATPAPPVEAAGTGEMERRELVDAIAGQMRASGPVNDVRRAVGVRLLRHLSGLDGQAR